MNEWALTPASQDWVVCINKNLYHTVRLCRASCPLTIAVAPATHCDTVTWNGGLRLTVRLAHWLTVEVKAGHTWEHIQTWELTRTIPSLAFCIEDRNCLLYFFFLCKWGLSAASLIMCKCYIFRTPPKNHRSGTSVNMVINSQTTAVLTKVASGWQCQAVLPAVSLSSLISEV